MNEVLVRDPFILKFWTIQANYYFHSMVDIKIQFFFVKSDILNSTGEFRQHGIIENSYSF